MPLLSVCFHSRPSENEAKEKGKEPIDAASLIAEALKRKFAHRFRHDSGQEEMDEFKLPEPEVKHRTAAPLVRDVTVFFQLNVGAVSVSQKEAHI